MEFTTIDRIITKLRRDFPNKEFDFVDVVEWTGEALSFINAIRAREEAVSFRVVKNYQCELPIGLHSIIQVAKNTRFDDFNVQEYDPNATTSSQQTVANIPTFLDYNGVPYVGYDVAYYRPYYDQLYGYREWTMNDLYRRNYVPVHLSDNSFFNTIVCKELEEQVYSGLQFEYRPIENKVLRFNFQGGLVAISYNRTPIDDNGIPKIPDDISFTSAIIAYIIFKNAVIDFHAGIQGAFTRKRDAERDWNWYCKQASNKSLMPQGIDEMENLKEGDSYLLPKRSAYENFFGNLNTKEVRNLLGTNYRNNMGYRMP